MRALLKTGTRTADELTVKLTCSRQRCHFASPLTKTFFRLVAYFLFSYRASALIISVFH